MHIFVFASNSNPASHFEQSFFLEFGAPEIPKSAHDLHSIDPNSNDTFAPGHMSQAEDFDDLGYEFFNTDGSPDKTVAASLDNNDFQEYLYTAGVTDDGIGDPLSEFAQFAIKIVMTGSNPAYPPRITDLRAIALAK